MKTDGDSLKGKVARGAFWALLEQLSGQIVNFGLGIVLARLLTPEDYGTVALVTIFIAVATVLVSSGFGQALVQKKDADDLDFSSVFWMSLAVAGLLVAVLFFAAPFIASFYGVGQLTVIVRVLSLNLILYASISVMNAELYRQMKFNVTFRISLWVALSSAVIGITLALLGCGVWALVWSSVGSNLVGVAVRFWYVRWRPDLAFSLRRLKPLWQYGWRMMAKQLLSSVFANLYGFLTGKYYSRADLAFVNKGRNIPEILANNLSAALLESSFPALAKMQDETARLREAVRRLLVVSSMVAFPLMVFLAAVSPQLIFFLYGEKWTACVPYMQVTCAVLAIFPLNGICNMAILAKGRSDVSLYLDLGQLPLTLLCLFLLLPRGLLLWYSVSAAIGILYVVFFYCQPCCRMLSYPMLKMLRDMMPAFLISLVIGLVAFALGRVLPTDTAVRSGLCLCAQSACALLVFLSAAWGFRVRAVREMLVLGQSRLPTGLPIMRKICSRFGLAAAEAAS